MAELKATVMQSGGDYTTVDACLDGEAQDLTDNGGDTFIIEISGSWSVDDAASVWNANWITNATCFITITAIGDARHTGKWTTTAHRLRGIGRRIFSAADYTIWDGLQIANTSTGTIGETSTCYIPAESSIVKNCIVRKDGETDTGNNFGIRFTNAVAHFDGYNNLIYDFTGSGIHDMGIRVSSAAADSIVSNNTIVNCTYGIYINSGDCLARNNLIYNCTNRTNAVQFADNTGYNATDGASFEYTVGSGGGGDRVNQAFTFVAAGADDYHLQSGDSGAKDHGTNLSGLFTIDIDDDTRSASWDIGIDEYIVAGVTVTLDPANIELSIIAPIVIQSSISITPGLTNIQLSAIAPTIMHGSIIIIPDIANIQLLIIAPTIIQSSMLIIPDSINIELSAIAPIILEGGLIIVPDPINLELSAIAPTIIQSSMLITPGIANIELSAIAPVIISIMIKASFIKLYGVKLNNSGELVKLMIDNQSSILTDISVDKPGILEDINFYGG